MQKICVIGSLNVDLTVCLPRFHAPGETISGTSFDTYTGGKGGNQAIAAARLGARVAMAGMVGEDQNGALYRRVLTEGGVDIALLRTVPGASTGVALIEVDATGENRIALVPGANALMDRAFIDAALPSLMAYDIFLLQLEIPMDTVVYITQTLGRMGKTILLDPAPAPETMPRALFADVQYITPNQTELALLTGMPTETDEDVIAAGRSLIAAGAGAVIAKRGAKGAMYIDADAHFAAPAFPVKAVDTTAAGDSFNAGFAYALSEGMAMPEALRFANAVGALSTTAAGAQQAMPTLAQVRNILA